MDPMWESWYLLTDGGQFIVKGQGQVKLMLNKKP